MFLVLRPAQLFAVWLILSKKKNMTQDKTEEQQDAQSWIFRNHCVDC